MYVENKPNPLAAMFFDKSWWRIILVESHQRNILQNFIDIRRVVSDKKIFKVYYIDIQGK